VISRTEEERDGEILYRNGKMKKDEEDEDEEMSSHTVNHTENEAEEGR
jgi:hypothetical protein